MKLVLESEEQVVMYLHRTDEGTIQVFADKHSVKNSACSCLAEFTPKGVIFHQHVSPRFGFPLEKDGRIRIIK